MSSTNTLANFTANQVRDMEDLIAINEELKKLEAKKKLLSDTVKQHMLSLNIDKVEVNGSNFTIVESTRKTVTKSLKDQFVAELVGMNKKHLVSYSIEPDLDSIFAEVDSGNLAQDFVDKYVKVTPVTTLRCI